jgi:hypothetical protein
MPDIFEDVKRSAEVANRPGKTDDYKPSGLRNEFSDASYKMAAPKKSVSKGPSMQDEMAAKAGMIEKARKALE